MEFRKQALIDAIDVGLKTFQEQTAARDAAVADWKATAAANWVAKHNQDWNDAANKIKRAVRAGKPITPDMVPKKSDRGWADDYVLYTGTAASAAPKGTIPDVASIPVEELKSFRAALESIVEDTITDRQVAVMGYKNVAWVFRAATANGGAN